MYICLTQSALQLRQSHWTCWSEGLARRRAARPANGRSVALREIHLVEEALAHLVHGDQVLERARAERDAGGSAERERRVTGQHVGVGSRVASRGDVERSGSSREVLLHPRKIGADPHAGDDAARVLAVGSQQRPAARHERGLVERGIEHAAELRIGAVTAAPTTNALRARMLIVSRRSSTLPFCQRLSRRAPWSRVEPRRIARPDAQDPSRERLLADDLGHVPVEHEPDALLSRAELQTARERGAVPDRAGRGPLGCARP